MRPSEIVTCVNFSCIDVKKGSYFVTSIEIDPSLVKAVMVSETTPSDPRDDYYSHGDPLFRKTTLQAFADAGIEAKKMEDLLKLGFYFTPAVKCSKIGYGVSTSTIKACSYLLEKELDSFPNLKVILLMGDVAIKALNEIARRKGCNRVIPSGSTYKIRGTPYYWGKIRVIPSYLQAGPSFFIEKSKRRMIAEDIRTALDILGKDS